MLRCAYEHHRAVTAQQFEKAIEVVVGGNRIDDEMETAGQFLWLVGIPIPLIILILLLR